jgi:hypothetical protein
MCIFLKAQRYWNSTVNNCIGRKNVCFSQSSKVLEMYCKQLYSYVEMQMCAIMGIFLPTIQKKVWIEKMQNDGVTMPHNTKT